MREEDDPVWEEASISALKYDMHVSQEWNHEKLLSARKDQSGEAYFPPKLDFVQVRRKAKSSFLLSPFRPFDRRGADYTKFLKSKTK